MSDNDVHEGVVRKLVERLNRSGRYHTIDVHVEYKYDNGKKNGEADIIALTDNFIHYYEVKCRYHPRNFERALQQFGHFQKTEPVLPVKYIYVSSNRVERIYLEAKEANMV